MKTNISIVNKTCPKYCIDNCLPYFNLPYLCMNAIFSKTMQDTETQISQFIVEGTANSTMFSDCQ